MAKAKPEEEEALVPPAAAAGAMFPIEQVDVYYDELERRVRWYGLEGELYGVDGRMPSRVKVQWGGEHYKTGWTNGLDGFKKGLKGDSRKTDFDRRCTNLLTIPSEALYLANRAAIIEGKVIVCVALRRVGELVDADPDPGFVANAAQVTRLLKDEDFTNQVGKAYRRLEAGDVESEEYELGNSVGGSGTKPGGKALPASTKGP